MGAFPSEPNLLFDGATLTTSYGGADSSAIEFRSMGNLTLLPEYDQGASESGNNVELSIQYSPDGSEWFQYGAWSDGGSGQMNFTTWYYNVDDAENAPIVINNLAAGYYRVRAKEEGGVDTNAGTLTLTAYATPIAY